MSLGVGPESIVAVAAERSIELMVGLLRRSENWAALICRWIPRILPNDSPYTLSDAQPARPSLPKG